MVNHRLSARCTRPIRAYARPIRAYSWPYVAIRAQYTCRRLRTSLCDQCSGVSNGALSVPISMSPGERLHLIQVGDWRGPMTHRPRGGLGGIRLSRASTSRCARSTTNAAAAQRRSHHRRTRRGE